MTTRASPRYRTTYSTWDVLLADPVRPMPEHKANHQLTRMYVALAALEADRQPTEHDWRRLADAVNLTETLVTLGELRDDTGLLHDAVHALAEAGTRHLQAGRPLRLSGPGISALRAVLESYAQALRTLPERTMVRAHQATEQRLAAMLHGQRQPGDVVVEV